MKNIHVLPTDKPSRLVLDTINSTLYLTTTKDFGTKIMQFQNIYITSDEEIKEGDYYLPFSKSIVKKTTKYGGIEKSKTSMDFSLDYLKKIILTTDQDLIADGVQAIDDEFLEWFVKNSSCEWVEVKSWVIDKEWDETYKQFNPIYPQKTKYKIIIPNLEIWKDIPNYEGLYQVSDLGRVKSLSRTITKGNITYVTKDKILKQSVDSVGYPCVNLSDYKKQKTFRVHQLVAIAFFNHLPNKYDGLIVDHIDNNKLNNMTTNLQLITNRKNSSKDKKNKTSKYTGVSWHKQSNKWLAQFRENGRVKYLGTFETEEEARDAYNKSQERMYSEEDMREAFENGVGSGKYQAEYGDNTKGSMNFEYFIEQFKKK